MENECVAVINQDLPDTLQRWHEISTLIQKNQTAIVFRLNELERTREILQVNFTKYRVAADAQQNYAKEEKVVADFGAKIESVVTDIETFKEHYSNVLNKQTRLQTDLKDLNAKILDAQKKITHIGEISSNFSKDDDFIKSYLRNNSIQAHDLMEEVNETITEKWNVLYKIIESNKLQLVELSSRVTNATLHLTSVENDLQEYKTKTTDCQGLIHHIANDLQLVELSSRVTNATLHLTSVENDLQEYKTKTTDCQGLIHHIANDVSDLKLKSWSFNQSIADMRTRCKESNESSKIWRTQN